MWINMKKYVIFILFILIIGNLSFVQSLDEETRIYCGGDEQLKIGCVADEQFFLQFIFPKIPTIPSSSGGGGDNDTIIEEPTFEDLEGQSVIGFVKQFFTNLPRVFGVSGLLLYLILVLCLFIIIIILIVIYKGLKELIKNIEK